MARALALAGAEVAIAGRSEGHLVEGLAEITAGTKSAGFHVVADVGQRGEPERVADEVMGRLGRVDILVSNAGANVQQTVEEIADEAWDEVLGVYVHAAMALTRALAGQMKERNWGRLIYISSALGLIGLPRRSAYSAAKAALMEMARVHAVEPGSYGITATCIAPGPFRTAVFDRLPPEELKVAGRVDRARASGPAERARQDRCCSWRAKPAPTSPAPRSSSTAVGRSTRRAAPASSHPEMRLGDQRAVQFVGRPRP